MEAFGGYVKNLRLKKRLTLRDFCRKTEMDPSNWSKVERGLLPPPRSKEILERLARVLGLEDNSEEFLALIDLAVIAHVPTELIPDSAIINSLPIFFRTIRGEKPSHEELEKLIDLIRQA